MRNATATITATTPTPHSPCDFIKESNDVISAAQHVFLQVFALHCECILCGRLLFNDLLTCLPVSLSVSQFRLGQVEDRNRCSECERKGGKSKTGWRAKKKRMTAKECKMYRT